MFGHVEVDVWLAASGSEVAQIVENLGEDGLDEGGEIGCGDFGAASRRGGAGTGGCLG